MCGIFAILNNENKLTSKFIEENFYKSKSRGPEFSDFNWFSGELDIFLGFHRLAINGLNDNSNQPFIINGCMLVCNGEIYNFKELYNTFLKDIKPETNSDCEVIIQMYLKYGIEYTVSNLDGEFAFILIDTNQKKVYAARDPYGVRPLFILNKTTSSERCFNILGFSSELKQIHSIYQFLNANYNLTQTFQETYESKKIKYSINQFKPGNYLELELCANNWINKNSYQSFSTFGLYHFPINNENIYENIFKGIKYYFTKAVEKRVNGTSQRPIASLLSGGLDSSIVTSVVSRYVKNLQTFSIGLEGSEDLKYAQKVADFLKTKHTNIVVKEEDFFNSIKDVIHNIESYDTTTVRASVGNYLVAKYISENSDCKVILNGDGSDELMGGYIYFHNAPNEYEFDKECKNLLSNIHYFDVLRSDRSISSNGLESRVPFLDLDFVKWYLSIPHHIRFHVNQKKIEKFLFRSAFDDDTYLPKEVLWRNKEAFSDGVSSLQKSWYEIITDKVKELYSDRDENLLLKRYEKHFNPPKTLEQFYYRDIFEKAYPGVSQVIPYFWMPKWCGDAKDASARTLKIYKK